MSRWWPRERELEFKFRKKKIILISMKKLLNIATFLFAVIGQPSKRRNWKFRRSSMKYVDFVCWCWVTRMWIDFSIAKLLLRDAVMRDGKGDVVRDSDHVCISKRLIIVKASCKSRPCLLEADSMRKIVAHHAHWGSPGENSPPSWNF